MEAYIEVSTSIANAANAVWENFATIDGEEVPPNTLDAMQVQLCRWQRRNFGDVSPIDKVDIHMGLGIIEEFGEALSATEMLGPKGKLDGLGDVCVYAGQLLNANRLAIRPVMDLADLLAADWDGDPDQPEPMKLAGLFSHVLLKHEQKIRGYDKRDVWLPALAYHVAAIIGHTKLDIIWHDRDITADNLIQRTYLDVGGSVVLKRNWTVDKLAGQTPA